MHCSIFKILVSVLYGLLHYTMLWLACQGFLKNFLIYKSSSSDSFFIILPFFMFVNSFLKFFRKYFFVFYGYLVFSLDF